MTHSIHYLYLLTNIDTGKYYVGVSVDPEARLSNHMRHKTNFQIMEDRELYSFSYEIITQGTREFIYKLEEELIDLLDSTNSTLGYNLTKGGFGGSSVETVARGESHGMAVFSDKEILDIRVKGSNKDITYTAIAAEYNTTPNTISRICSGKRWTHIGGPITIKKSRITEGTKNRAKELKRLGNTYKQIAEILGIKYNQACKYGNLTK